MLLAKTLSYTLINNKPQPPEGVAAVAEHLPIRTKSYIWEYSPPITLGTSAGGAHSAQTALLAYFLRAVELERIFGHGNGSYRSDEQLKFPSPKMRISGRSGRVTVARVKAFFSYRREQGWPASVAAPSAMAIAAAPPPDPVRDGNDARCHGLVMIRGVNERGT